MLRRPGRASAWLLGCALGAAVGWALDPAQSISQYHKRRWQIEDGLPQNYVTVVCESPDRYLLVATADELVRFDGMRFSSLPLPAHTELARKWVTAVLASRTGAYWFGTQDGFLYRWDKTEMARFSVGRQAVQALFEDLSGTLWIGTPSGMLRWSGGGAQPVPGLSRTPGNAWDVFAQDAKGDLWIVTLEGLNRLHAGKLVRVLPSGGSQGTILSVDVERPDVVWVGTSNGLYRLEAGHKLVPQAGIPGPVSRVLRDRHGNLWVGTWGAGLYRLNGGRRDAWSSRDGLPDNFIRTLYEDREGNLWIGTRSGGLSRWRSSLIVPFGTPEGVGDFAATVYEDPTGTLWLGTWRQGLFRLDGRTFVRQPTPDPVIDFAVRAMGGDGRGNLWLGNWEGLYRFDGRSYRKYTALKGFPYVPVSAILCDRSGGLWLGTDGQGLVLFSQGEPLGTPQIYLPESSITSLLLDSRNQIWAGTATGVYRIGPHGRAALILPGTVTSVCEDSRRRVWALLRTGALALVSEPHPVVLDARNGLPGQALYRLLDDHAGWFWISTSRGLLRVAAAQVDAVLSRRSPNLEPILYTQYDGLRTVEFHGLSQPAGWRQRDGSLWFPTPRGFARIRPAGQMALPPPKVVIETASSAGRLLDLAGETRLEAGSRVLEVRFTALRLGSPEQVRFRYRMQGLDSDWIEHRERTARYPQLPPGAYRFLVCARDADGPWSEPASFRVRQMPRFHQTWWFLMLLGMAGVGLAGLFYRWRLFALKGRYAAVVAERNRIAGEWHDTLLAGFSAISWQLDTILTRLKDSPAPVVEAVDVARKMIHFYRAEARRVIWDLRDSGLESGSLPESIASNMQRILVGAQVQYQQEVAGEVRRLPGDLEHHLLRLCQEAVTNAVQHGEAGRISIRIEYQPDAVGVQIRDDGRGFDPARFRGAPSSHFGLTVMEQRVRRFDGLFRVQSRPGSGTIIHAQIPLPPGKRP